MFLRRAAIQFGHRRPGAEGEAGRRQGGAASNGVGVLGGPTVSVRAWLVAGHAAPPMTRRIRCPFVPSRPAWRLPRSWPCARCSARWVPPPPTGTRTPKSYYGADAQHPLQGAGAADFAAGWYENNTVVFIDQQDTSSPAGGRCGGHSGEGGAGAGPVRRLRAASGDTRRGRGPASGPTVWCGPETWRCDRCPAGDERKREGGGQHTEGDWHGGKCLWGVGPSAVRGPSVRMMHECRIGE